MEAQESKDIYEKVKRGAGEVTQYLITTFTDSSGIQHKHVAKLKDNQTATVINAESKDEAMKIYEGIR